jgi:hypothetical protein
VAAIRYRDRGIVAASPKLLYGASRSSGSPSNRRRAASTFRRFSLAQPASAVSGAHNECPSVVSRYSTRGGTVSNALRAIRPSRCKPRSVNVSIRWEIPGIARWIALNRMVPDERCPTTITVHLSPMRSMTCANAAHSRTGSSFASRFAFNGFSYSIGLLRLPKSTICKRTNLCVLVHPLLGKHIGTNKMFVSTVLECFA